MDESLGELRLCAREVIGKQSLAEAALYRNPIRSGDDTGRHGALLQKGART